MFVSNPADGHQDIYHRIRPGDLVDRATTWPLNNGARIRHPLGVVVRDAEGRVISKAKAICA